MSHWRSKFSLYHFVGMIGLEPTTFSMSTKCSNQLNYTPIIIFCGPYGNRTHFYTLQKYRSPGKLTAQRMYLEKSDSRFCRAVSLFFPKHISIPSRWHLTRRFGIAQRDSNPYLSAPCRCFADSNYARRNNLFVQITGFEPVNVTLSE